jgi:hypothetical protein
VLEPLGIEHSYHCRRGDPLCACDACVHLNRKLYRGLLPVVDRLLGISTQAVFLLTRNCSSKFRPLICPMKDRFFRSLHPASQTVLEKRVGLII